MLEEKDPIALLGGTALKVYLYMLKRGRTVGVREVQRALGFKSPSTARHHLERLVELGLAMREGWGYKAIKPKGILGSFIALHGAFYPKTLLLLGFLLTSLVGYSLMPGRDLRAVAILSVASLIAFVEVLSFYRSFNRLIKGK